MLEITMPSTSTPLLRWLTPIVMIAGIGCSNTKQESPAPAPKPVVATPSPSPTPSPTPTAAPDSETLKTPRPAGLIGTGRAYRRVYPGAAGADGKVAVVVAGRDMTADGYGQLDALPTAGDGVAVSLTTAPTVDFASITLSSTAPPAVAFLSDVDPRTGLGTLKYADLQVASPSAKAVPGGGKAISDALTFGPDSRQLLFLSEYNNDLGSGKLNWWGGGESSQLIAERVGFRSIVVNRAHTLAIVATNLSKGAGDLVQVDLATGKTTPIGTNVTVLATADVTKDKDLNGSTELAFSVSPDGSAVAYSTREEKVFLWSNGKTQPVAPKGRFPAVSDDGKTVAFHSDHNLVVWSGGRTLTTQPSAGLILPKWSPDGRYVAFLTSFRPRGFHPLFGTSLGDVAVWKVGGAKSIPWGTDAAWQTVHFGPDKGATTQLSLVAQLKDISEVATLDRGFGTVLAGSPDAAPRELGRKVRPEVVKHLPISGGVAFTQAPDPFVEDRKFAAYVWKPGTDRPKELVPVAMEGSLITGEVLPPATRIDQILLMANPEQRLFDDLALVGTLMAFSGNKPPIKLLDRAFLVTFTADGKVLAMAPAKDGSVNADVWLLPLK
jgi:hypothetical protein